MRPHIFHVKLGYRKWVWVIADARRLIRGQVGETRMQVIGYWEKAHGQPTDGYDRVTGICGPADARARLVSMVLSPEGGAV